MLLFARKAALADFFLNFFDVVWQTKTKTNVDNLERSIVADVWEVDASGSLRKLELDLSDSVSSTNAHPKNVFHG